MSDSFAVLHAGGVAEIGGKAAALSALSETGLPIPPWFAVCAPKADGNVSVTASATATSSANLGASSGANIITFSPDQLSLLQKSLQALAPNGELLAVRSSAVEEDSVAHSFAGQYDTRLFVHPRDVPNTILELWRESASERVVAYRAQHGLTGPTPLPAMLVQRMVNSDIAGVAFSADPVSGRRATCVVAATYGLGTAIVSGDVDADSWHIDDDHTITSRVIAEKRIAHRAAPNGTVDEAVPEALATAPALTDAQIAAVATLARATEQCFGRPQDIEWAIEHDQLYLLQSRPITSLGSLADPDGELILWDNSNIVESYGGITTPLTFSFARYVYENVYREFCKLLRVPPARLRDNEGALRTMLGLIRGRVYYNLVSWYRILALLPGYQVNRAFMEQMMGVSDSLPAEVAKQFEHQPTRRERYADMVSLLNTSWALVGAHRSMTKSIKAFEVRLNTALALGGDLSRMRPDQLVAHYRELERALLAKWDAPLVNDFFAMIFYGVLRKLSQSWCRDTNGTLQNDLVSGDGAVISAEPAKRIVQMAELIAHETAVVNALCDGTPSESRHAIANHPALNTAFTSYLEKFGDRCLEELKLETMTLDDDPMLLARSVGRLARAKGAVVKPTTSTTSTTPTTPSSPMAESETVDIRGDAERAAFAAIGGRPLRRMVFRWVLKHARHRIRDRENLRFERTRVFGRVRRIFVELGKRYHALGQLHDARDVFYLTVDEALGWPSGATASINLQALASARKAEFESYASLPAPPDRFLTRGTAHVGEPELAAASEGAAQVATGAQNANSATERTGTGCYPGTIRGRVRVVRDPRSAILEPGEILVAERTDPGWVMLFPAASGLLVERGSLLSHSAIVARELALPAVVSIAGLTSWLVTGDLVEFNGRTGVVTRLEESAIV